MSHAFSKHPCIYIFQKSPCSLPVYSELQIGQELKSRLGLEPVHMLEGVTNKIIGSRLLLVKVYGEPGKDGPWETVL